MSPYGVGRCAVVLSRTFDRAGVEFIDENGGGPGVRLRKRQQKKAKYRGTQPNGARGINIVERPIEIASEDWPA